MKDFGPDLDQANKVGTMPVVAAIWNGHTKAIKKFVSLGATVHTDVLQTHGLQALFCAAPCANCPASATKKCVCKKVRYCSKIF